MSSRNAPRPFLGILLLGFIGAFITVASCNHVQRVDTLHASVAAVKTARDQFTDWDKSHRLEIVDAAKTRADADAALARYQAKQKAIADGFALAFEFLAVAATQTDDPSLQAALAKAAEIVEAFTKLKGDL